MDVLFDPHKARENLRKHEVSLADAESALWDPHGITVEDPDALEEYRFITIGMDALGRVLVVIHTPRDEVTRLISARKASSQEVKHYAQRI